MTETNFDYKIGQLTGQVTALVESIKQLTDSQRRLEEKFENALKTIESQINTNVQDTALLKFKMSLIGGAGGVIGGLAANIIQSFIVK